MIRGLKTNLRAVERSDARFVCDLLNDASIQAGWGTAGIPVSVHLVEHDIEQWLATERTSRRPACLIIDSLDGEPIGLAIVAVSERLNQSLAALSLAILPDRQDQGFGRDAMTVLIDALFDDWRIHRIQMTCEDGNERAAHLYESLGFMREATRSRATYMSGEFHDQHVYSLLATDTRPDLT